MECRIEQKRSFTIWGKGIRVTTKECANLTRIPEFWTECCNSGLTTTLTELGSKDGVTGDSLLGVCTDYDEASGEFTYLIAVEAASGSDGLTRLEVPEGMWAIFGAKGSMPGSIQELFKWIHHEWFPSSGFGQVGSVEIEVYPPGDTGDEGYEFEVWIPVVSK